jgi:ArsR family transcriptional regulator
MNVNSTPNDPLNTLAERFRLLGQPARLKILLSIGHGETCVCHLEVCLGYRQAYISQQLMILRDAGLVTTRRNGKHIYYALSDCAMLDLMPLAAKTAGFTETDMQTLITIGQVENCTCPHCNPGPAEIHPMGQVSLQSPSEAA